MLYLARYPVFPWIGGTGASVRLGVNYGKTEKTVGDRADARWIRELDGLHVIMPHLMDKRTDAEVYVNMEFDVTEVLRYIEEKNRGEEEYKATLFHCILMAIAKTVYLRPDLNRYISGRRYYQRHEITLGFVAKKRFEDHSEEKLVVTTAPEDWTLTAVTRQVVGKPIRPGRRRAAVPTEPWIF